MSVQHDVLFSPILADYTLGKFSFETKIQCTSMCLHIPGCQLVTYDSTDSSCTIYNSTVGVYDSINGCITYTVTDKTTTASLTTEEIIATTEGMTSSSETTSMCVIGTYPSFDTNLLSLWRFDNNANDDKELHDGTMIGGSYISQGYINADLGFASGALSHVYTSYIDLVSTSFTIELWVRIEYFTATDMMLVSLNDLKLRVSYDHKVSVTETPPSSASQLTENKWYHIALVYDNSLGQQKIYINGILDSISTVSFTSTANNPFFIGALDGEYGDSEFLNGEIDHLSITTRIKSACEILRDASLVASYTFASPPDVRSDSGAYGVTGTISGPGDPIPGVIDEAMFFDGSFIYFQTNGLTALTISKSAFSYTLFIRPWVIQACSLIFLSSTSEVNDTEARPYLGIDSSGKLVAELPPSFVLQTNTSISAQQWSHVALTYSFSNDRISLYINGSLQISVSASSPSMYVPSVAIPPVYLTLGHPRGGPNGSVIEAYPFTGDIDEFNIWSRELNATEIYAAATIAAT